MRLPENVENVLKARGERAAVKQLCRQHGMSRGAASAWVAASDKRHDRLSEIPLTNGKVATLLMAAFLSGMLVAALEKLF